jgi:membrane protease YdiL (CAAX protease family)
MGAGKNPGNTGGEAPSARRSPPASGPVKPLPEPVDQVQVVDAPATFEAARAWLGFAVAGFAAGYVLSEVILLGVAAAVGDLGDLTQLSTRPVPPAWVVVSGLVGLWMGFIGAAVLASRRHGTGNFVVDLGLRFRPIDALLGPAVGVGGQLLLIPLLYLPLHHVVHNLDHRLSGPAKSITGGFHGTAVVVIGVLTVVVVPFVEEIFFRGLLLRSLSRLFGGAGRHLGPTLAVVFTGLIFGLAHFELLELLGLAVFGMVLAVLARRTGRLGPCILAHASFNLVAVVSVAVVSGAR